VADPDKLERRGDLLPVSPYTRTCTLRYCCR